VSVSDIFKSLVDESSEEILPFTAMPSSSIIFYAEVLRKNKNDCSIPINVFKKFKAINTKVTNAKKIMEDNALPIAEEIVKCYEKAGGKKAVAVPLTFQNTKGTRGTHANILLFNPNGMFAEHFEPHGRKDYGKNDFTWIKLTAVNMKTAVSKVNTQVKKLAKEKGIKELQKGFTYLPPVDVCPAESLYKDFKGVQSFDTSKKEDVTYEGFTIKENAGYCQAWAYFLLDLRLQTLDKPPQEVLMEYSRKRNLYKFAIRNDPNKTIMGLIRGYSKIYFNVIKKLINEGKFTLEEFLRYRDIKKNKDNANFNKISDILYSVGNQIMEQVMSGS